MKRFNTGNFDFENIITHNQLYVDKTEYLYELIQTYLLGAYAEITPVLAGSL